MAAVHQTIHRTRILRAGDLYVGLKIMKDQRDAIAEFWRFFQKYKVELAGISSADHPVYDLILEKLQQKRTGDGSRIISYKRDVTYYFLKSYGNCEDEVRCQGQRG